MPSQITLYHLTGEACVEEFNDVAISFNHKAASLVKTLKPILPGLKISYIDIYDKPLDIIKNPSKYGNIPSLSDSFMLEQVSVHLCAEHANCL